MPSIYFYIDELARDAVVAANLKSVLNNRNIKLVYGNRSSSSILKMFNPFDILILPSLEHFRTEFPDLSRLKSKIIILPTESVGLATKTLSRINAKYFGNEPDKCKPWFDAVSIFCLWGKDHLRCFQEIRPDSLSKCHVVGHPRFDDRCIKSPSISKGKKSVNKIKVGFISRFSSINTFHSLSNLELVDLGMKRDNKVIPAFENSPDRDVEDRFYTQIMDIRIFILLFERLDLDRFDVTLRVHPRENRYEWLKLLAKIDNRINMAPWDMPFMHWASEQDYLIGPPSTSFYDCFVLGKKPVCTMNMVRKRADYVLTESDDNNRILDYVYNPDTISELLGILCRKDESCDMPVELKQIINGQTGLDICSDSIGNIANICSNICDKLPDNKLSIITKAGYVFIHFIKKLKARLKRIVLKEAEQSSTFQLFYQRIKFIDKLSNN